MMDLSDYHPFVNDDITAIIEHINDEHIGELQDFACHLLDLTPNQQQSLIATHLVKIYYEGILLNLTIGHQTTQRFLPFDQSIVTLDELNHAYVKLVQKSQAKQGKKTIQLVEQSFTVSDSYFVTQNMFRLVLEAPDVTPLWHPGYAYLFNIDNKKDKKNTNYRYYTLRKGFVENGNLSAWVDIFIHNNNPGGNWAMSLEKGDVITSKREFPENLEHLQHGQALLIADETSLPTVARLLELWQNPISPIIILITQNSAEHYYLDTIEKNQILSEKSNLKFYCLSDHVDVADSIMQIIERLRNQSHKIDKVWGGLNADNTKVLRRKMLPLLSLTREDAILKVYWR